MFGWGSSTSGPTPKKAADGKPEAPDRSARAQCYEAREAFFACLDQHGIIDSIEEKDAAAKYCAADLKRLERDCASSWVDYFKRRRVMEHKKKQVIDQLSQEGATKLPGEMAPPGLKPASSR